MKEEWKQLKLSEICISIDDGDWIEKKDQSETGIRLVQTGNIGIGVFKDKAEKAKFISNETFERLNCLEIKAGDILISRLPEPVGRGCLLPDLPSRCITAVDCSILRANSDLVDAKWIVYYTMSNIYQKLVNKECGGATRARITRKKLSEIQIPVPSLSEQERIVKILDAAFEKIDRLKQNAEKSLYEVKKLWEATLTKELSYREGWKETTIGEICEIVRGKRFVRADIVENGVPCIHYGDMYTHYGMSATKAKGCVSPELAKKLRFANKNDVVVVAAGENKYDIGVGMVWLGSEPAVVHDACFILKHSQNPMFLSYYFRSTPYHQYLKDEVNEGKICSFLTKPLAAAKISLPPLAVQNEIVKKLDDVRDRVEKLIANYKETIDSYAPLKQAILRKAFSGEL